MTQQVSLKQLLSSMFISSLVLTSSNSHSSYMDFSQAQPGEHLPGGDTTHRKKLNSKAFMHPIANMPFEQQLDFRVGNGIFKKIWVSSPSSTTASDGLGPLFNARSCMRCHIKDGRGHPPSANFPDDTAVSMFLRLSIPAQNEQQQQQLDSGKIGVVPEPNYGQQLQDFAVQGMPIEGRMHIRYEEKTIQLSDGETASLRIPTYSVTDLGFGPLHPDTMLSARVAPPMIGLGLLEAIPENAILAQQDIDDSDNDGISGRANKVWDKAKQGLSLGRFGWKAGNPTLDQQNTSALNGDIGISNPMAQAPSGDCTEKQTICITAPNGNTDAQDGLEASKVMTDLILFYTRTLAVPTRPNASKPEVLAGKQVFFETGCQKCHTPSFKTADSTEIPQLAKQTIWPYSDLLLHDMGEGLADNRPEFAANGREWRTPPLWGIGLTKTVNGHQNLLHDGRARNLLEAILWHGGEAETAKQQVIAMPKQQRANLIHFLESL